MKKLLFIALLIVGCEDENPELENFRGITEIDSDGNIISEDSDDWYGSVYRNTHCETDAASESDISEGGIGITMMIPTIYSFLPAYPNPFDSLVSIHYDLPTDSNVQIRIIDRNGNQIQILVNDNQNEGNYCVSWDGKDESGEIVSSQLYRLLFSADEFFAHGDIMYAP